jgi:DNA-binding transcriptional ArsR family regulator
MATPEEVRALAHPLRLRVIRLLYDGPRTNKELAERLGENPATMLHHVRTLLRTGFVALDSERAGPRGRTEKLYRTTGKSWQLDVDAGLPAADRLTRASLDAFLEELHDAGEQADLSTARLALVLTPERRVQLEQRLFALLNDFADDDPDDGEAEHLAVFVAIHHRI